jgi:hypothetical protein
MKHITLIITLCVFFTGCGPKGPAVQMVEGTVSFDGEPVADAVVGFVPKGGSTGIPAVGQTDENGVYHLTSSQGGAWGKGAVTGEYDVRVSKFLDLDAIAAEKANKDKPLEPGDPALAASGALAKPKHHLPEKYADEKTSGLTVNVKKGKNVFDFDLKK